MKTAWKFMGLLEKIDWNLEENTRSSRFPEGFRLDTKTKPRSSKNLRVWTKNQESFEKFQENFEILIKISMENKLFSQFYTIYFLDFWLRSETIDIWKITLDFYNNFYDLGWRARSGVPLPPDANALGGGTEGYLSCDFKTSYLTIAGGYNLAISQHAKARYEVLKKDDRFTPFPHSGIRKFSPNCSRLKSWIIG